MFGTKIADEFFPIHTGGDVAFVNGVLKELLASGGDRPQVRHRAHARVRRAARASSKTSRYATLEAGVGRDAAPTWRGSRGCTRRASPRCSCGRWASRSTSPASTTCTAIVNLGSRRGNVGRDGRRAHADPRALRRAGRRRDGLLRDHVPGRRPINATSAAAELERAVGHSTVPPTPGLTAADDGRRRRATASSTCCGRAAATSSTCCPRPTSTAGRARARPGAHPPGHRAHAPDARRSRRGRGAAARGDALRTSGRRHVDHDRAPRRVQPRDPGTARRRGPQRVADLRRHRAAGSGPSSAASFGCESAARDPRGDRTGRARVRRHREAARRPATRSRWGGTRLCEGGVFPTPDGRARFRGGRARAARHARRSLRACRRGAASSSTPWSGTRSIR